jgi:hypothetical protein
VLEYQLEQVAGEKWRLRYRWEAGPQEFRMPVEVRLAQTGKAGEKDKSTGKKASYRRIRPTTKVQEMMFDYPGEEASPDLMLNRRAFYAKKQAVPLGEAAAE